MGTTDLKVTKHKNKLVFACGKLRFNALPAGMFAYDSNEPTPEIVVFRCGEQIARASVISIGTHGPTLRYFGLKLMPEEISSDMTCDEVDAAWFERGDVVRINRSRARVQRELHVHWGYQCIGKRKYQRLYTATQRLLEVATEYLLAQHALQAGASTSDFVREPQFAELKSKFDAERLVLQDLIIKPYQDFVAKDYPPVLPFYVPRRRRKAKK